jgi:hypothetical protein
VSQAYTALALLREGRITLKRLQQTASESLSCPEATALL